MVNDEDISNQTILDYCHKLAESKRPRRGFNIYCQA